MARVSRRSLKWVVIGAILVCLWMIGNQTNLQEWLDTNPHPPSAEIERLAKATTMTRSAQRLFYRQNPVIEQRREFWNSCRKVPVKGVMLGCYTRQGRISKISIQAVTEPKLNGIMEITAAHEMLHAAYDTLNDFERDRMTQKLEQAVSRVNDPRLLKVLEQYKADDRPRYLNELHSHLGTELMDFANPELDQYYERYFTNRRQLVTFAVKSGAAVRQIDERAEVLKPEIDRQEADLKARKTDLDQTDKALASNSQALAAQMNQVTRTRESAERALAMGDRSGVIEFETEKSRFNEEVTRHNEQVRQQQEQVDAYNELLASYQKKVKEYNQLGRDERSLFEDLKADDRKEGPLTPNSGGT
jgi:hypothetical protein